MLDAQNVSVNDLCDGCLIRTKKWNDQFISVYRSAVVAFLEYLMQIGKILQEINYKLPISLLLAGSPFLEGDSIRSGGRYCIAITGRRIVSFSHGSWHNSLTIKQ
jgi:hypothetical protein